MSFLLKDRFHQSVVESIYNEFLSRRSDYYYFIGKVLEWDNPLIPDTPDSTYDYEHDTRNRIISLKRVNLNDVSLVVRRINWVTGTVYDYFDPNYSSNNPAFSGATSLKTANFYVLTSQFNVYKCLFNNNDSPSTVEPTNFDPTPITTSDGYIWKYMYTVPLSIRNRFITQDFMPVQRSVTNAYYSDGQITNVIIDNPGSGYLGNADVTLTVQGQFLGLPGNAIANLRPVLNSVGEFIDVIIDNPGNNYKTASITITDNFGSGTSHNKGVSNVKIYTPGSGYFSNVVANTSVTISTTGTVQPASNAQANLIFSSNQLVDIVITNPGSQYSSAALANTTITISTTGNSQPSSNASANLFYNSTAKLTPVLANGQIQSILIEDQGKFYSSNIQTTISLIGDGQGAILTPFVNSSGQIEDVVIESKGSGYTHADITFVGNGINANAYVNFSLGGLDTIQSIVELSAVNGGIYSFRVSNVGNGYSYSNVTVSGDGENFAGNVVLTNNTVSYITVQNPGSGYTYANVSITGDGGNANVVAILSPFGGHGSDAVSELFCDTIMFTSTINNEKNQGINVVNDYRQFGIIKNPKVFGSSRFFSNVIGSTCYLVTCTGNVNSVSRDDIMSHTVAGSIRYYEVVEPVSSTNQLLLTNLNNHTLEVGDIITNETDDVSYEISSINKTPDINKFSGDILYIDNRTSASHSSQQLVTLRTIIRL